MREGKTAFIITKGYLVVFQVMREWPEFSQNRPVSWQHPQVTIILSKDLMEFSHFSVLTLFLVSPLLGRRMGSTINNS